MSEPVAEALSVVIEREFPFPPDKIWRALTQPHLIAEWLMPNDFRPLVGHRFNLRNQPRPDVNVVLDCEIRAVEPNKTLSYTWNFDDPVNGLNSVVTFTLTPTGAGTRLRMEQSGFRPGQPQNYRGATAGWHRFFAKLEDVFARGV